MTNMFVYNWKEHPHPHYIHSRIGLFHHIFVTLNLRKTQQLTNVALQRTVDALKCALQFYNWNNWKQLLKGNGPCFIWTPCVYMQIVFPNLNQGPYFQKNDVHWLWRIRNIRWMLGLRNHKHLDKQTSNQYSRNTKTKHIEHQCSYTKPNYLKMSVLPACVSHLYLCIRFPF